MSISLTSHLNPQGIITALAMDQRGSLHRALTQANDQHAWQANDLAAFKRLVIQTLSSEASSVLLDPLYGLEAATSRTAGCGLLLAYEQSGYDNTRPHRHPLLESLWSVHRLQEAGATGIKLLVYYNPEDGPEVNGPKHSFVERVGAECAGCGLPFFLEPLTYNDALTDELTLAKHKPDMVKRTVATFSAPQYRVSVLKVELPVMLAYTSDLQHASPAEAAYSRAEAMTHLKELGTVSSTPLIYLSAGISMALFSEGLALAGEAGARYNGVLCGRATWKDAIAQYATQGADVAQTWLNHEGRANIATLNTVVNAGATAIV